MSNTCSIHGEISSWNGRSMTCGGARDFNGNWLTCTCVNMPAPPPLSEMRPLLPKPVPPPLSEMPPPPSWAESRPLRHCHRVGEYKNPKDLPLDAYCLCGECKPRSRAPTEDIFARPHSDDEISSIRGGSTSLRSMTGATRLRSTTGGGSSGSSNSLDRTGACTPQCSCEVSGKPCGDRQESEEEFVPPKRTDSVIGLTLQGELVRSPMYTEAERLKQD